MKRYDIIIIGGGASGMMAAYAANLNKKNVLILEKNEKTGKKLYITGKGRCNITSSLDISDFFDNIPTNPSFLYSSLYSFTNVDLIEFFNNQKLAIKEERGNRYFPESDKSSDVIKALNNAINNVEIRLNSEVISVRKSNDIFKVKTKKEEFECVKLIIATGGLSYPTTGSTGDGYEFAKVFDHSIVDLKPSLCPIITGDKCLDSVTGITVKNAEFTVFLDGKKQRTEFGDFLFTHRGVSGPIAITLSDYITDYDPHRIKISCNFKPAIPEKELDLRLIKDINDNQKKDILTLLTGYFPKNIAHFLLENSDISSDLKAHEITKELRIKLKEIIRNYEFKFERIDDIKYAIVTKGGIDTKEINPQTMESKLIDNLYFCGEVIDVNGYTGGFNLQIAFSTGFLAGKSASE